MKHIWALEIKRFNHWKRNKRGFLAEVRLLLKHVRKSIQFLKNRPFFQFVGPLLFVLTALMFAQFMPDPTSRFDMIELHPWLWQLKPEAPLQSFVADRFPDSDWSKRFMQQLLSPSGMGTKCIPDSSV